MSTKRNIYIRQEFMSYIKTHKKISEILDFIEEKNQIYAPFLHNIEKLDDDEKIELVTFLDFFSDEFGDLTFEERIARWGKEPVLFEVADECGDYIIDQSLSELKGGLTPHQLTETRTLFETIMDMPGDKRITFMTRGGYEDQFLIPAIYGEDEKEYIEKSLEYDISLLISERDGIVIIRTIGINGSEMCAFNILPIGVWQPVLKSDLISWTTTTPSGFKVEPEDGIVYKCMPRTRFK